VCASPACTLASPIVFFSIGLQCLELFFFHVIFLHLLKFKKLANETINKDFISPFSHLPAPKCRHLNCTPNLHIAIKEIQNTCASPDYPSPKLILSPVRNNSFHNFIAKCTPQSKNNSPHRRSSTNEKKRAAWHPKTIRTPYSPSKIYSAHLKCTVSETLLCPTKDSPIIGAPGELFTSKGTN